MFQADILSQVHDAVIALDAEQRVAYMNRAAEEMFDRSLDECLGQRVQDLFRPRIDGSSWETAVDEAGRTGHFEGEVSYCRKDGARFPTHARLAVLPGRQGDGHGLVTSIRDITDRKSAEEAIRSAERETAENLTDMTLLHRVATKYVGNGDMSGVLNEVLDAAIAITRADMGSLQLIDGPERDLRLVAHRGFQEAFADYFRLVKRGRSTVCEAAATVGTRVIVEDLEASSGFAPADVEWLFTAGVRAVESTPLVSRSGQLVGMFSTHFRRPCRPGERELSNLDLLARLAADLIERSRAFDALHESEEHYRRSSERLRAADRLKGEFLATLSHELRNPLAAIQNGLAVIDRSEHGGAQAAGALEIIRRQSAQLSRLVDDLLDVTRITQGKIRLRMEPLDLDELVHQVVQDSRRLYEESGIELDTEFASGKLTVAADGARLSQVLGNLLSNAAKYTPRGGQVKVTVAIEPGSERLLIKVKDTGVGIAHEVLGRLFQPFVQAETTLDRSRGGLGLGLALTKGLVELHGGTVTAHSDGPGRGSEFVVSLPASGTTPGTEATAAAAGPVRSRRVLLIEDNPDVAETLEALLALEGHEVAISFDGPQALARARQDTPDVVLCDIGLPGMDGYAVARAFRADPKLRDIFLVALSGYAQPEDVRRARRSGFDRHMAKPPDLKALVRIIDEAP